MADNTEHFNAIVEADIKKFLARMQQVDNAIREAATGASVQITLNATAFLAQMQQVQAQIHNLDGSNPDIDVNADIAAALAQLQLIQSQANNLHNSTNTVHVQANIADALAELQRVRKQAEDLAYSDVDVHVEVEAERALERFERIQDRIKRLEQAEPTAEVNADIREAMRELNIAEREIQMLTQRNHEINIVTDVASALGQLRLVENVTRRLEQDTTYVDIKTDAASALAEMAHIRTQITQLDAADPTVDIHAETTAFMARLAVLQARIEALKADNDVRIDADTSRFTYKLAMLKAQLLALNRTAIINIEARINAFQASIGRLASNIRSFGEVIGYSIGGAFTALLPTVSPILANIGALLGNLGVMVGLVGTQLTGLIFGIATAAAGAGGVLAVAIGNVKKLYEEGTKLNAQQQEAKAAISGIKDVYNALVKITEQPILAGVTKGAQAASTMMKMLEPMFVSSAKAFDGLMQSFKQSLGTPPVQAFIEYLNTSAGPMLTTFGKAIGNLFQGLGSMMVAFAPITQHVADGFLNMSNSFAQWAAKLSESDKFKAFSDYFQTNMPKISSMFGDAIVGVVQFFSAFGTSASGMMTYLVDLMARWREWSATLSENQAFQNFLSYVSATAPSVMTLIGQLTTFLVNLGIGMAPLGAALMTLVNGFLAWTNSLMQNHPIVGQIIAVMTTLFGAFMAIMPVVLMFKSLFAGLGTVLLSAATSMGGLLMTAIRGIGTAFTSLMPVLTTVVTWFTTLASRALPLLASAFGLLSGPVGVAIAIITALIAIGVALYKNWDEIKAKAQEIWSNVKTFIVEKATQIKTDVVDKFNELKTQAIDKFNELKTQTINKATELKTQIVNKVTELKTDAVNKFNELKTNAVNKVNELKTQAVNKFNELKTQAVNKANELKTAAVNKFNELKTQASNKVSELKTAAVNKFNELKTAASQKMQEMKQAVVDRFNEAKAAAINKAQEILSGIRTKFTEIVSAVQSKMAEVKQKIESKWNEAKSFLEGIDLTGVGRDVIQGLINGITSMLSSAVSAVSEVASAVVGAAKSVFNTHSPSRVFHQIGDWVTMGLANGIADKTRNAVQSATNVANAVIGATRKALDTHSPSRITTAIGEDVTQGLANGITDNQKAAEDAATKAAEDAVKAMEKAFNTEMKNLDLRLEAKAIDTDAYVAEAKALAKKYEQVTNATATVNAKIVKASEKEMKAASSAFSKQLTVLSDAYKAGQKDVVTYGDELTALSKDFAHVEGAIEKVGVKLKDIEDELFKTKFDEVVAAYKNGELAVESYVQVLELMGEKHSGVSDRMLKIDKELATARFELAKQTVADIVANEQMGAVAQIAEIERISAAYAVGTKQREQLDKEAATIKESMYSRLNALSDDYLKKISDAQQAEADGIKKLTDEYMGAIVQRSASIRNFAGIFDEVTQASAVSGQQLVSNLRGQVTQMSAWADNMQKLAARGVNDGLIKELQELGPKSAPQIAALNTLTDAELTTYVALWQEKSNLAAERAIEELEGLRDETDNQIAQLRSETKTQLDGYEKEWETSIRSITDGTVQQFSAAAATMPAIGANIIQNLMSGMSSMKGSLMAQVQDIASSVTSTLTQAMSVSVSDNITSDLVTADVLGYTAHSTSAINKELAVNVKVQVDGSGGVSNGANNTFNVYGNGGGADDTAKAIKRMLTQEGLGL